MKRIRQPIISVLGHVDHGKTSILDRVRESTVASREAGGITQHIGATEVPIDVVKNLCGPLLQKFKTGITIPGLLFIDTPGHAAFTNLRKRGGSIADLAVLVVDVREGFMPQTIEALDILKTYKTPFIIAANKIDLLSGWTSQGMSCFLDSFKNQRDFVRGELDTKIYELIGRLSEFGMESERFDRVGDFTKQIAIIPTSGKTGEGIPDLLMMISGMSQRFLEKNLNIEVTGAGKGSILEVKEERGLGTTLDVILYSGSIKRGDTVILSGLNGPIETKVKALLKPKPLDEMRDPRDRFDNVEEVSAASGVKLVGPGIDEALPGGQVLTAETPEAVEGLRNEISESLESVRFDKENDGLIIRADTLGSLEAILGMFADMGVPVRKADIGAVSKQDLIECESIKRQKPELAAVVAFNAQVPEDIAQLAADKRLKILSNKVIYKIMEEFEEWQKDVKVEQQLSIFDTIPFPSKLLYMDGCTFRRSDPAVVGVEVLSGKIRKGYRLMKEDGTRVGHLVSLQDKGEDLEEAHKGQQLAVGIEGPLAGRNIKEGDVLYTFITQHEYEELFKKGRKFMTPEDEELLREIMKLTRGK